MEKLEFFEAASKDLFDTMQVGISYNLKVSQLNEDAEQIWLLFKDFFGLRI